MQIIGDHGRNNVLLLEKALQNRVINRIWSTLASPLIEIYTLYVLCTPVPNTYNIMVVIITIYIRW